MRAMVTWSKYLLRVGFHHFVISNPLVSAHECRNLDRPSERFPLGAIQHSAKKPSPEPRRCRWREFAFMHFFLHLAIQPALSLLDSLRQWQHISLRLREPPRKRLYQQPQWQ